MTVLLVALGAALGAPLRYLTDRAVQTRHDTFFPWGTLAVNGAASLLFGVLAGAAGAVSPAWDALLATGFCGALSTFSTFGYETFRLAEERAWVPATANVLVSLLVGLGAVSIGWPIGAAL